MDARELALLVQRVRQAQRDYFRSKSPAALELSKRLERELDEAAERVIEGPGLFTDEQEGE